MGSSSFFIFYVFLILLTFANGQDEPPPNKKRDKYDVFKGDWCGDDNCYDILDVTPDVAFREIKQRYNNLSLALHPDKNPNQSSPDKERYVRINRAYEILSNKRRDYDEYLRIKVSMDSPVESPILVLILLYLGIAYVVLYYQRQKQQTCKDAILKNASVIRYYWEEKQIDLTGKKKPAKSPKKGKGKGSKGKKNKKNAAVTLSACEIKKNISIDELNDVISSLNLAVPGWKDTAPTYTQAMVDVLTSVFWLFGKVLSQLRWIVQYKLLKQPYTDSDREYLCRNYHKKTEIEWNAMPEQDRIKLLNKPGKWKKKDKGNDKKQKKKRN